MKKASWAGCSESIPCEYFTDYEGGISIMPVIDSLKCIGVFMGDKNRVGRSD